MFKSSRVLLLLLGLLAIVSLVACGGGSTGSLVSEIDSVDNAFIGVSDGDFKAVRFNEAGYRDAALNSTIGLNMRTTGNLTQVTVEVSDSGPMYGVALDLHYDANRYNPTDVAFNGLVDNSIDLAVTRIGGLVALAQASHDGRAARSGDFVTVTFSHEPAPLTREVRTAHTIAVDTDYAPTQLTTGQAGFVVTDNSTADTNDAAYMIYSIFAAGDGDDNGETNASDITPLIAQDNFGVSVSDTNFGPAATDYDRNGEVNISELTTIGQQIGAVVGGVEVLLGNTNVVGDATVFRTHMFADGTPASRTATKPFVTTNWADVFRTWNGTFTEAELSAADTDVPQDGEVYVFARPTDGTTPGNDSAAFMFVHEVIPDTDIIVDAFVMQIVGATGGTGGSGDIFDHGDTADANAGIDVTLNVTEISGTYTGTPFTVADVPGTVPQDEYDAALAWSQGAVTWTTALAGDPDMRATGPVVGLPVPPTGTAVDATIFPDDDPESVGATGEGTLTCTMGALDTRILADIVKTVTVDVAVDADAPEVFTIATAAMIGPDHKLESGGSTNIVLEFNFGAATVPTDFSGMDCVIYDFDDADAQFDLTFTTDDPPPTGQFTIRLGATAPATHILAARVAPVGLDGHEYGARVFNDAHWSSVNKPGEWMVGGPPLPLQDFIYLPRQIGAGDNDFTLFYPDPQIRRDPELTINDITGDVTGTNPGYDDILKISDQFFPVTVDTVAVQIYPDIAIIDGTDPTMIGTLDDDAYPAVLVQERQANRIVLDLGPLVTGGVPGPDEEYAFKLFSESAALGDGTFTVAPLALPVAHPTPLQWGINVFGDGIDRGTLDYAGSEWGPGNQTLKLSTVGTATPDVLFVEFTDGTTGNWPLALADNVRIIIRDDAAGTDWPVMCDVRTVGLGVGDINVITVHEFVDDDIFDITNPAGGIIKLGGEYMIRIEEPTNPGVFEDVPGLLYVVAS